MSRKIRCPNCDGRLLLRDGVTGSRVQCPLCQQAMVLKGGPDGGDGDSPDFTALLGEARPGAASWTNVGLLETAPIGTIIFSGLYLLVAIGLPQTAIGAIFLDGWVPAAILFLASWSGTILVRKWARIRVERWALRIEVLPEDIAIRIRRDGLGEFWNHMRVLPRAARRSLLVQRVVRGLEHFRLHPKSSDVARLLGSQADLDAVASESSFTMLKSFIWAVPILGFIGTVIGITDAVGSFSVSVDDAETVGAIKESLGGVTSGLGYAFNTTLIALFMSIVLMIPTNWLQKAEDELLNGVAVYCNEELLGRLDEGGVYSGEDLPASSARMTDVLERLVDHMERQHEPMEQRMDELDRVSGRLIQHVARAWRAADKKLRKSQQENQERMNALAESVIESSRKSFASGAASVGRLEASLVRKLGNRMETVQTDLTEKLDRARTREEERGEAHLLAVRGTAEALEVGLREFSTVATTLREEIEGSIAGVTRDVESLRTSQAEGACQLQEALGAYHERMREGAEPLVGAVEALNDLTTSLREDLPPLLTRQIEAVDRAVTSSREIADSLESSARSTPLSRVLSVLEERLAQLGGVLGELPGRVEEVVSRRRPRRFPWLFPMRHAEVGNGSDGEAT